MKSNLIFMPGVINNGEFKLRLSEQQSHDKEKHRSDLMKLRELTNCSLGECMAAYVEANHDLTNAVEYLMIY